MFSEFEKGNQTGLKSLIMRGLCGRILQGEDIKLVTVTGQEWYDELKAHTIHIYELNGIGAKNYAQQFYHRKTGAAFSKEMARSVRVALKNWQSREH